MSNITNPQKGIIATICQKLQFDKDAKAEMVSIFSDGRCTSSTGLSFAEAAKMIATLKDLQGQGSSESMDKMTGKIFYYAHEMGWVKTNGAGKRVADGQRVDEWMVSYSYLKKKLSRYKLEELPKLVSQFAQVYKHYLKSI